MPEAWKKSWGETWSTALPGPGRTRLSPYLLSAASDLASHPLSAPTHSATRRRSRPHSTGFPFQGAAEAVDGTREVRRLDAFDFSVAAGGATTDLAVCSTTSSSPCGSACRPPYLSVIRAQVPS